jgi:diketogulonate reductase-like aldo/keto reductase
VLPDPVGWSSCGGYVQAAQLTWMQLGGRRIDNADSYHNQRSVGIAMKTFVTRSGTPRSDLFLTSKVGPYLPLGYNETLAQFANILAVTGAGYTDLVLIHWPTCDGACTTTAVSTDPPCVWGSASYDERLCRLSTWRALVSVWKSGGSRSIGVSNYNSTQLQEIADAGLPLPAVVQNPFHIAHSVGEMDTLAYCNAHNITFNGYSPLGVPDRKTHAAYPAGLLLNDPVALAIAAAHGRSVAEVMLAWQWSLGILVNPRTQNAAHMLENLDFMDIELTASEIQQLSSRPQD